MLYQEKKKNNEAHHLYSKSENPERKDDITNGVSISRQYHIEFQNIFGQGGNTPEQFEAYCKEKHGITSFPWRSEGYDAPTRKELLEKIEKGREVRLKNVVATNLKKKKMHTMHDCLDLKGTTRECLQKQRFYRTLLLWYT